MLVGIIGKAGSGKDTFAVMLAEALFKLTRQRYVLIAYAHELKIRIQKDFDMSYEQLWGDEKEKPDLRYVKRLEGLSSNPADYWSPREILQSYAEFYRSINTNFWVDYVADLIDDKEYNNVILTDVRYVNEAGSVVDRNGKLIRVVRDDSKVKPIHGLDHISEVSLDNYTNVDFVIDNNNTIEDLKHSASKTAEALIKKINK